MKQILVPIDFSETSSYALETAANIAREHNSHIILLHMLRGVQLDFDDSKFDGFMEASYYRDMVKKRIDGFLENGYLKDVSYRTIIQNYRIFKEVGNVALEHEVDLIVMGSHGVSGIFDQFVGSNTEKVVRSAEVPVLVIKKSRPEFKLNNVLFACDFKKESLEAYNKAMRFFNDINCHVQLLYIHTANDRFTSSVEIENGVDEFLRLAENSYYHSSKNTCYRVDHTVEDGIYNYLAREKFDAIAISTHGRKGLSHFFMGSIGEDIANHTTSPVITFKM
ncbi:universal stress protein [Spongiivirga sp. MCCC 1A20706]|uniref:universal stress protein n=1 Tax=Spongiivirga sp. MCCC 1A20706 TaxID=3160963 RepID=UPI0039779563